MQRGRRSLPERQIKVECETRTKDDVSVSVVASIQYRVLAKKDAFYNLTDANLQIQSLVSQVIRASVPDLCLDDAFQHRKYIVKAIEEELEKAMSEYEFDIAHTLVVDIEPMNEVDAAEADTMKEIGASSKFPHGPGSVGDDVASQIRQPLLQANGQPGYM